jgi:hypothetical protein
MKERKQFIGRLNSDADISVFPENEMLACENISSVIASDGRIAAMKPAIGNRRIAYTAPTNYPFPDSAVCVGSFTEEQKGRVYFLIRDKNGNKHQILCYFHRENIIRLVFHSEHLAFSGLPVTGIDKIGDMLYWTEDNKPPKRINVERGLKTYGGMVLPADVVSYIGADGVPTLKDITLIRPNPAYPVTPIKTATNQTYNFISDNAFQFAYRYVYRDKEVSVLSPYSRLINYNSPEEDAAGLDAINISIPQVERIGHEVDKVQLLVRSGNIGTFFIIKQWTRTQDGAAMLAHNNGTALSYVFYNDQNGIAISEEESAKPFDNVPIVSRALAGARNRLFLGNNTFGYNLDASGRITIEAVAGSVTGNEVVFGKYIVQRVEIIYDGTQWLWDEARLIVKVTSSQDPGVNGYYDVSDIASVLDFGPTYSQNTAKLPTSLTVNTGMRFSPIRTDIPEDAILQAYVEQRWPDFGSGIQNTQTVYTKFDNYTVPLSNGLDVQIRGVGLTGFEGKADKTYKSDSRYKFGVVFYDFAGRNAGVYTLPGATVNLKARTYSDPSYVSAVKVTLDFTALQIPEWAVSYQIVRTKNLTYASFVQGYTKSVQYVGKDKDGNYLFGEGDNTVYSESYDTAKVAGVAIDLSGVTSYGLGYAYSEGDYVNLYFQNGKVFRAAVISQVGQFVIIQAKDYGSLPFFNTNGLLFEIASERKTFLEEPFYEIGEAYAINAAGTANRALSKPSITVLGDIYIRTRTFESSPFLIELMNPDDGHWQEWLSDIGRINIEPLNSGRSVRPTNICYSNVYLQSTEVNGLSTFDALDFRDLDLSTGAIRKLALTNRTQEYGSVMLAICESETSSIYLGETRIIDNAENVILATSGEVIGTINPLKGSYGTVHPESVYESEGRVYFVDAIQGKVIMYSANGLEPISQNGTSRFFTSNLFEISPEDRRLFGVVDKRTESYMFYIPQMSAFETLGDYTPPKVSPHNMNTGRVYCYLPELQGWSTALTFEPEWMDALGETLVSWKNGYIYVHDTGQNTFYGVTYPSTVSFAVGSPAAFVKTAEAIAIEGSRPPDWVHLRGENPYIQSTDLEAQEFISKEGVHYASFLRDRNTPGYSSREQALLFGEAVRSQFLKCAIRFNGDSSFYVTGVSISYDRSLGHGMLIQSG